jgi:hypothetical protein
MNAVITHSGKSVVAPYIHTTRFASPLAPYLVMGIVFYVRETFYDKITYIGLLVFVLQRYDI